MKLRAAIAALAIAAAAPAAAQPATFDTALQPPPPGLTRVLIATTPGAAPGVANRLQQRGRSVSHQFTLLNLVSAEVSPDDLASLAVDPSVANVSMDAAVVSLGVPPPPGKPAKKAAAADDAPPARALTGKGVGVAVIDSGLAPNGDFSAVAFYDFTSDAGSGPYDDYGHGTHVAGLIASKGALSQHAYTGIAPGVRLIAMKVLDAQGYGRTSDVIRAIEFATLNKAALGVDIINLSLGHPIMEPAATDPLVQAVEAAVRAGIVVVVSAGNIGRNIVTGAPGYAGILSPGNAPSAITVGALDTHGTASASDDTIPSYSSRGPTWYDALVKPDLVAAGQNMVSDAAIGSALFTTYPDLQVAGNGGVNRFMRLSGTSMSAAEVTGVAALLVEDAKSPGAAAISPETIKEVLEYTALPLADVDPLTQGHGELNA